MSATTERLDRLDEQVVELRALVEKVRVALDKRTPALTGDDVVLVREIAGLAGMALDNHDDTLRLEGWMDGIRGRLELLSDEGVAAARAWLITVTSGVVSP